VGCQKEEGNLAGQICTGSPSRDSNLKMQCSESVRDTVRELEYYSVVGRIKILKGRPPGGAVRYHARASDAPHKGATRGSWVVLSMNNPRSPGGVGRRWCSCGYKRATLSVNYSVRRTAVPRCLLPRSITSTIVDSSWLVLVLVSVDPLNLYLLVLNRPAGYNPLEATF
jgi:hypothetical protein